MILPRVIPVLLVADRRQVKSRRFRPYRYVGDPINSLAIFSALGADEIVVLDIEASRLGRGPDLVQAGDLASECTVPLAYGGGIRTADDAGALIRLGVEKVVINTATAGDPDLITRTADLFGSQAVVAGLDVRRDRAGRPVVWVRSGQQRLDEHPVARARRLEALGAGEILLTDIDRDGGMAGYDLDLVAMVAAAVTVPVIACGGAGCHDDLRAAVVAGASAAAAGSLFVFRDDGQGVTVHYPDRPALDALFAAGGTPGKDGGRP
ncbi:MAG: imidazole glycerol phosphate synthase subunit HisF [Magnetospirillum sp.]|nr:MAG: imidazole glycerol phosphate synthase subunit HisF [Magnetospirillum sp.]